MNGEFNLDGVNLPYLISLCESMLRSKAYPETNGYWRSLLEKAKAKKEGGFQSTLMERIGKNE